MKFPLSNLKLPVVLRDVDASSALSQLSLHHSAPYNEYTAQWPP